MRIVFCGVGALGSGAVVACRNLAAELVLVDFDRVESKNLLAQAYVKQMVGKHKAEALRLQLANFWGRASEARPVRLGAHNAAALLADATLAVDAFDNRESRELLSAHARAAGVALVHAAVSGDGTFALVRWDERFVADAEDAPGAATCEGGAHLPLFALASATLARAIQDFAVRGARHDYMVSLGGVVRTA